MSYEHGRLQKKLINYYKYDAWGRLRTISRRWSSVHLQVVNTERIIANVCV